MKSVEITLCLIVKNEERYLSKCIESVLPLVSKILIADTGSTDDTLLIARRYSSDVESIDFSGGFSVARNHLLKKVLRKDKKEEDVSMYNKDIDTVKTVNESKFKFSDLLNEEISKMKNIASYDKKTQ